MEGFIYIYPCSQKQPHYKQNLASHPIKVVLLWPDLC